MNTVYCDVAVIGGGPAGLAAATAARREVAEKVLILERDAALGGILQQCIHPGFGLNFYNEELTGPEYAARFIREAKQAGVEALLDTMVLHISEDGTSILCTSENSGISTVRTKSTVLAMGCRERTRANLMIPGTRPAGIYTAGAAQRLTNRQNTMVGKKVVILGSGDIGMIMARRMTLEGAEVLAVVEIMGVLAGLTRNKVQCLDDFGIPLMLSHTITNIKGNKRVEGVTVTQVDSQMSPIPGTEKEIPCDTLLLSVGLLPENELSRKARVDISPVTGGPVVNQYMQTSTPAIFACGNVVHVNDLVDNVTVESLRAGKSAARYAAGVFPTGCLSVDVVPGDAVRYICPQKILMDNSGEDITLFFRALAPDRDVHIVCESGDSTLSTKKVKVLNPGEMEKITIRPNHLARGNITVRVAAPEKK